MKAFRFDRPTSLAAAARSLGDVEASTLKAGGIDLLDRMKERVSEPDVVVGLVDVEGDGAREIHVDGGRVRVGALVTLAQLAESADVRQAALGVAEAAAEAASPQIRNLATVAGNLAQRNRCRYFRHTSFRCFRRGATICSTHQEGAVQDMAGIFDIDPCASSHPSSLAPPLSALGATLHWVGADGKEAEGALQDLWYPERVRGREEDLALPEGAVIAAVSFPVQDVGRGEVTAYEEIRQRAAFDWALASCGVRLMREGRKVSDASIWLGAVSPTPWRATTAEQALVGHEFTADLAKKAAEAATQGATPLPGTRYKVQLVRAAVRRALEKAWGRS